VNGDRPFPTELVHLLAATLDLDEAIVIDRLRQLQRAGFLEVDADEHVRGVIPNRLKRDTP
jgi:hypothetical protein